jgi:kynureninase
LEKRRPILALPTFDSHPDFARHLDATDPLRGFADDFLCPTKADGGKVLYLTGHSLGLCPRKAPEYVQAEMKAWAEMGVRGHFKNDRGWYAYHESFASPLARLVGAYPTEVVAMNSLTVNLHLMLVSFYRPDKVRNQIYIEAGAFPSDNYAVATQTRFHGFDPQGHVKQFRPRTAEHLLRTDDIVQTIEEEGDKIAVILLGQVNYLTGQALDLEPIIRQAHRKGCIVGIDLAHGIGNLGLELHRLGPDFAVWCSYKYLNGGPGCVAGCFVHDRHGKDPDLPRFGGWWGHDKARRFLMEPQFQPMPGAEGWQLSNPPILPLACLRASLELFDAAGGMEKLVDKQRLLTGYLEFLLNDLPNEFAEILTPRESFSRGCQLSVRIKSDPEGLVKYLEANGVTCDFRRPDILRAAPVPLYNGFEEVYQFVHALKQYWKL